MKKVTVILLCAFLVGILSGCGTIKGVGEDIKAVGGWLTKSSDEVKEGGK